MTLPIFPPGGPFHTLLRRAHVVRDDDRDVRRNALVLSSLTWLPLMVLAITASVVEGKTSTLLTDLSVHVRCLLAIPLFLAAEAFIDRLCTTSITRIEEDEVLPEKDLQAFQGYVQRAGRRRNGRGAELSLACIALAQGQLTLWAPTERFLSFSISHGSPTHSVQWIWYTVVSLPVFLFLLYRVLWHWLIWSWLLWKLSRLALRPLTTHPDLAGGLGHLSEPTRGFAVFLLAVACVVAAAWETRWLVSRVPLQSFILQFVSLLALGELFALAPLLPFAARLARARLDGLSDYGRFALTYTRLFQERWLKEPTDPAMLGSNDISALADMEHAYEVVRKTRLVPFDLQAIVRVAVALTLPMLILVFSAIPVEQILRGLLHALLGGG